jgi:superfamily II DNA/RNA helicase
VGNGVCCNHFRLDVESKLPEQLKLAFVCCRSEDKSAALLCLLKHVIKPESLTVVFAATKHHVEYLHMVRNTFALVLVRKLNFSFKSRKLNSSVHTLLQFVIHYIDSYLISKHLHQQKFQRQCTIFMQLFIQIQFFKANVFIRHVEVLPAATSNTAYHSLSGRCHYSRA